VCCSDKGFTLIEVMASLLILTVGLLGLFQAVYATISYGMANQLRNEAVTYGDQVMGQQLNKPFALASTTGHSHPVLTPRSINGGFWNFSSDWQGTSVSSNTTSVQVRVSWRYKGTQYTHNLSSLVSQSK